tara:strand:- start:61 stop:1092 length:1032 start_codon:yes stop_codon:yes gene_type:complete
MSEPEEQTPMNGASPDQGRLQAAINALTTAEAEPTVTNAEEETQAVEAQEATDPGQQDDDQPITPGEENVEMESSGLASIARRERRAREQAKEREESLRSREKELEDRLKKADELESRLERLRSDMQADPVSALREMGIEDGYSELATALYDEELGEDSPDEWKAQRETRELSARLRRLEQEQKEAEERIKSEKQQAEFNEFQRNYLRGMDSYMSEQLKGVKSEESGEMTIAQALYESNPTQAVEAMYGIALQVAHEDPNAPLPTPELLAEQLQVNLEESLGPIIEIMMKSRAKEKPQVEEKPARPAPKTLRNAQSPRTSKRTPAMNDDERLKRALAALEANQ